MNFLSAAIHPSVSNNYRVMVLRFTVLLRDLEAFFALRHDSCLSFLHTYLLGNTFSAPLN